MPMLIALHRDTDYEECIADIWAEYLTGQGVEIRWVDLLSHDAFGQLHGCDGVMWRWGHKPTDKLAAYRILHSIEVYLGIPVFPDHRTSWHYEEKLTQYYLLKAAGVATPKTWVFWEKEKALEWAYETDYPKVFKLSSGAGGSNVVKVSNAEEACRLIDRMFGPGIYDAHVQGRPGSNELSSWRKLRRLIQRCKAATRYAIDGRPIGAPGNRWLLEKGYAYFQEFILHDYEIRIRVIGNRAWAIRRYPMKDDFRASIQEAQWDYDVSENAERCVPIVFDLSEQLKFQSMAMDFLIRDGQPVVTEMSYVPGKVKICPGYWGRNMEWVNGDKSTADAQAEDFLARISAAHTNKR